MPPGGAQNIPFVDGRPPPPSPPRLPHVGFYQVLMPVTSTLETEWPPFVYDFFSWMRLFTFDLMVLPFIGCLNRSSYVNSFFITVLSPVVFIVSMLFLKGLNLQSKHDVWRNSIYLLFLVYPRTCETIINAFLCYKLPDGRQYLLEDFNISCNGCLRRSVSRMMHVLASSATLFRSACLASLTHSSAHTHSLTHSLT